MKKLTTPRPGEDVTNADIVPYAKGSCSACCGTGVLTVNNPERTVRARLPDGSMGIQREAPARHGKLCGCAIDRFLRAHAAELTPDKLRPGVMVWKGDKPAPADVLEFTTPPPATEPAAPAAA